MSDLVLVTGITGFVAQHVAAQLLDEGCRVRGTLRDPSRSAEARAAVASATQAGADGLEFATADLEDDRGWAAAMAGAAAVMHVASPIPLVQPKDRDALVGPARDGALRVLAAARDEGGVRKVVLTSSVAAIADGHGPATGRVFTEDDWSDPEGPNITPYARSKTIAERAAWDFMAREKPGFALSVVNPGLVLGPTLSADHGVSPEIVRRLLAGAIPGTPALGWETVDVRDVARLHVLALRSPDADGQRFIASSGFIWMSEMAEELRRGLSRHADRVPTRELPSFILRLLAIVDPAIRGVTPDLGRKVVASHDKARRLLGWEPRSPREAVLATAESLVRHGVV